MAWTTSTPALADARPTAEARPGDRNHADRSTLHIAGVGSVVSHDLRTPLNAIIGFAELMGRGLFGPLGDPRYEEYVSYIGAAGRDLLRSTEETLALITVLCGQGSICRVAPTDLRQVALESCAAFAGDGPRFDLSGLVSPPVVADRVALRHVFDSLLKNAVAASPRGQRIAIATTAELDLVRVTFTVHGRGGLRRNEAGAGLMLARRLLELHGSALQETELSPDLWAASFSLERQVALEPIQADLFTPA
jgi:signal transduction histidine kinase